MDVKSEQTEEPKVELEDQIILRLPQPQADAIRNALRRMKSKKFKKLLTLNFDLANKEIRKGTVKVKKEYLHAKLVDLPCVMESTKTTDKVQLFKTADLSQMLICQKEEFVSEDEYSPSPGSSNNNNATKFSKNKKYACRHGLAPPLKNVRKQRFRKILRNKEDLEEVAEIEKELLWLLRADNEAVSTRFELYYEEPTLSVVNERTIFGEVISDSDSNQDTPLSSAKTSSSDLNNEFKIRSSGSDIIELN